MRVLVVNDQYSRSSAAGAAVSMAEAVASRAAESGAEIDVLFLASVQERDEAEDFESHGIEVSKTFVPPYTWRWRAYRTMNYGPAIRTFKKYAHEFRPDVVHFHNVHMFWSYGVLRAARKLGVPVVLSVHDVMPFCCHKMFCFLDETITPETDVDYRANQLRCLKCQRFRFNPLRNRIIKAAIKGSVDCVAPVSRPMGEALERNRIPIHEVVYNGIDCEQWKPLPAEGEAFRKKHGLEAAKIILHGGRLDQLKGGFQLVRAVAAIRHRIPTVKLMVLGRPCPFIDEMISLAASLGVEDCLHFPGWLREEALQAAYAASDLVASPSLCFESFNLMNLEGMAMAKPVVTSFFGGPSEVVSHPDTGFHVNPLNESDLSDKLASILGDDALAARMGVEGRRRAEALFDIKITGNRLISLYERLLSCKMKP